MYTLCTLHFIILVLLNRYDDKPVYFILTHTTYTIDVVIKKIEEDTMNSSFMARLNM